MFCSNCGKGVNTNAVVCISCGAGIKSKGNISIEKEWSDSFYTGSLIVTFIMPLIGFIIGIYGLFTVNKLKGLTLLGVATLFWILWTFVFILIGVNA